MQSRIVYQRSLALLRAVRVARQGRAALSPASEILFETDGGEYGHTYWELGHGMRLVAEHRFLILTAENASNDVSPPTRPSA